MTPAPMLRTRKTMWMSQIAFCFLQLLHLPSGGAVLPAGSAAAIAQMRAAVAEYLMLIFDTDVVAGLLPHRGEDDGADDVDVLKLHQLHSC